MANQSIPGDTDNDITEADQVSKEVIFNKMKDIGIMFSLAYGESVLLRHAFSIHVDQQGKDRL
ncbi:hypothetical protein [Xenorhabdus innexi]|uniref:hypothetical protein n=1 Tax=Xenorhabdus innexi TaxID=290109 RepID=UPI000B3639A1|nr:hypothetical protein [Xenorhabdus innexi]